jgi:uncharacterized protein YcfJ
VAQWLRHCALRKVAGLIPDGVTGNETKIKPNETKQYENVTKKCENITKKNTKM